MYVKSLSQGIAWARGSTCTKSVTPILGKTNKETGMFFNSKHGKKHGTNTEKGWFFITCTLYIIVHA
jgi:hypothetical protein